MIFLNDLYQPPKSDQQFDVGVLHTPDCKLTIHSWNDKVIMYIKYGMGGQLMLYKKWLLEVQTTTYPVDPIK